MCVYTRTHTHTHAYSDVTTCADSGGKLHWKSGAIGRRLIERGAAATRSKYVYSRGEGEPLSQERGATYEITFSPRFCRTLRKTCELLRCAAVICTHSDLPISGIALSPERNFFHVTHRIRAQRGARAACRSGKVCERN